MTISNLRLDFILIYFVYGLAFFSMGIALLLETMRSPTLVDRRALVYLAIFGLLHGMHEWVEIIILQGIDIGLPFPTSISWARVAWLVISFIPLVIFGVLMLQSSPSSRMPFLIAGSLLALYIMMLYLNFRQEPQNMVLRADDLARYLLAVPGAILAGFGLRARAHQVRSEGRHLLSRRFWWAAFGFILYGITQIFVPPSSMFPASVVNTALFISVIGIPIQLFRAAAAVLITMNLIQAIQVVEKERQQQLVAAQQARLEALQQIQNDLLEREALRQELLRHTVIAQEEERSRIARELHDETAQFLTALDLNLATLRSTISPNPKSLELISWIQDLTRDMSRGIYRLVRDLRPAQLDDLGLVSALQLLVDEQRSQTGLNISLSISGSPSRLDHLVETVFFRIAQEALTNVARHAHSQQAFVTLEFRDESVVLRIQDNGVGLGIQAGDPLPQGWGLAGMRERAESVGGTLSVYSPPSGGTLVECHVPSQPSSPSKDLAHESHPRDAR